ncbi:MAG TPA: hypothetical protein VHL09_14430 [Dehalococcoidia bacterium]|nr:hypothetical protein [Dehalococcoidia bacterium]
MGKQDQDRPSGWASALGRLTYPYYDQAGFTLTFGVTAYADRYQITLWWNGARCRRATRRTLAGALNWATREADGLLVQFGMPAKQVPLSDLIEAVERRLAA